MNNIFLKLSKSKFRNSFKLKAKDLKYIKDKGIETIKEHAYEFIIKRIASQDIQNDGKQTPIKGHPVFIAQHATATCCRNCIDKWHHIPKNRNLNNQEIDYIVNLIIKWIKNNIKEEDKNDK